MYSFLLFTRLFSEGGVFMCEKIFSLIEEYFRKQLRIKFLQKRKGISREKVRFYGIEYAVLFQISFN